MPSLTKIEEYEATALAEELLAQVMRPATVVKKIAEEYNVGDATARRICKNAEGRLMKAGEEDTKKRRTQHVARLEALYRRALQNDKLTVCESVLRQLGRIHGVEAPQQIHHTGSVSIDQQFESRSDAELDYYIEHQHWPEEAPRHPQQGGESAAKNEDDPLAGLH